MAQISLKILNQSGEVLAEKAGNDELNLVYMAQYQEGDYIELAVDTVNDFYYIQFDDAKGKSLVYLTGIVKYAIPFGEKAINTSAKVFAGGRHVLWVKKAFEEEKGNYRLLSENVWDQHGEVNCYPHASANVETRGESVFAAVAGTGRALGYVCAPSLLQEVIARCVDLSPNLSDYSVNRALLLDNLTAYGYECVSPDGAFYLFIKAPNGDGNAFSQKAKEKNLLVVPGESFGCREYVRISYCVDTEIIERALPYFKELIEC